MSSLLITIKDLYPDLPTDKVQEVEEAFDRYLDFVMRSYERIQADPHLHEEFRSLTGRAADPTMEGTGRSLSTEYNDTDV